MTREVGVGSAYAGLQRARERGNVCVCLCCREIGKEFVRICLYTATCMQDTADPCGKAYIILVKSCAMNGPSFGSHMCPCILTFDNPS